jgi:tetratricopeptide (TPR) repeat protein
MIFSKPHWLYLNAAAIFMVVSFTGCESTTDNIAVSPGTEIIITDKVSQERSSTASYLVARQAFTKNNIPLAAEEFAAMLTGNPANIDLMKIAFSAFYLEGDVENAALLAIQLQNRGEYVAFGSEPALILAIEARDYLGMRVLADHLHDDEETRPLGVIAGAWSLILLDQGDAGLTRLHELKEGEDDLAPYVLFSQNALMNEYLGRSADAATSARMTANHPKANIATIINMAGVLVRQGLIDEAYDILDQSLDQIFDSKKILNEIKSRQSPLFKKPDIDDLLAIMLIEASAVRHDAHIANRARLHLSARLSSNDDHVNYVLGRLYQDLNQFDQAMLYYDKIGEESLWYQPALLFKARYMSFDGQDQEEALKLFIGLTEANPNSDMIWQEYADAARRRGDYQGALEAYEKAISLNPTKSRVHFLKAIVLDRLGQKEPTEAALRQSIALNPQDAIVLNYLGYWLLEEDGDPEEALGFIRKAIEKQPQNGAFLDSLGWGHYRLGQYKRSVLYLERAVALEPQDPLITDHLGDAYAKMGRIREAQYQWERALSFEPEEELSIQIMSKLDDEALE